MVVGVGGAKICSPLPDQVDIFAAANLGEANPGFEGQGVSGAEIEGTIGRWIGNFQSGAAAGELYRVVGLTETWIVGPPGAGLVKVNAVGGGQRASLFRIKGPRLAGGWRAGE